MVHPVAQVVLLATALAVVSAAGSAFAPSQTNITTVLMVHNRARAEVGVAPLRWNISLEVSARLVAMYQRDTKKCHFIDDHSKIPYGINQEIASWPMTVQEAVGEWVKEKKFYNYTSNSCAPQHKCEVYTQVVWKGSLEVGCGQTLCEKGAGRTLTICLYNPSGNYNGEKPY